jgi:hypothetical protein
VKPAASLFLAITRKGDDARRPPAKSLQSIGWKPEPRGPGNAERMLADAEGERLELLAYPFVAEKSEAALQRVRNFRARLSRAVF